MKNPRTHPLGSEYTHSSGRMAETETGNHRRKLYFQKHDIHWVDRESPSVSVVIFGMTHLALVVGGAGAEHEAGPDYISTQNRGRAQYPDINRWVRRNVVDFQS